MPMEKGGADSGKKVDHYLVTLDNPCKVCPT